MDKKEKLSLLCKKIQSCTKCGLLMDSTINPAFGKGNINAKIVLIGEACGKDETEQGIPFIGRAGRMLDKVLAAIGWTLDDVYICNILKCRPPANRNPSQEEANNCRPYLDLQLDIVNPEYIICLGKVPSYYILEPDCTIEQFKIGAQRKQIFDCNGVKVLCTYHPSYLLRNPAAKKEVWDDLQFFLEKKNEFEEE
jgi:DNA polymerase